MQRETIFYQKLTNIHKSLFSSLESGLIENEIDGLYSFIKNNFKDLVYYKKFEELINNICTEESIKNNNYTNSFFKKYINKFFQEIKTDNYSSWGILLNKLLSKKTGLSYPVIYSAVFRIYFDFFELDYEIKELNFPLLEKIDLQKILTELTGKIYNLLIDSSSYDLAFYSSLRNKIILFLFDLYKKKKSLSIWFPEAGIGFEPLLVSYTMHLLNETETKDEKMKNFKIFSSDANYLLLNEGLKNNFLNDLLVKTKTDFANENYLKEKEIKTSISESKKNIICADADFLSTGKIIDDNFDVVIINSLRHSDFDFFNKKITKRLKKISELGKEIYVILQVKSKTKIEPEKFFIDINEPPSLKPISNFEEIFISRDETDYFTDFLLFKFEKEITAVAKEDKYSLYNVYSSLNKFEQKDLKKVVLKIDKNNIKTEKDNLIFSFLLAKSFMFSKSFDILKYNFHADYNLSFKILNEIIKNCKNKKLTVKAENFIIENQIKEMGFSEDMLEAIIDGIDEFYEENKNNKWL
jgi:hypothetical protein